MKPSVTTVALMMLGAGCSAQTDGSAGAPVIGAPSPAPSATPTPTPLPTPTPTPAPTPTPTAAPVGYLTFEEIYAYRIGAGITLASACSGFTFQGQPPAILPATGFGQGLSFRYISTPQVWAISGEVAFGVDGRDGEPLANALGTPFASGFEVAYSKTIGADLVRFSIARPMPDGRGLDYVRLALVSAPVAGVGRLYHCVLGSPTTAADVAAAPSGAFARSVVLGSAYGKDGTAARTYALSRSVVTIAADQTARRVTVSLRLVGTPIGAGGGDVELGTFAASAPIDPATGNFAAPLSGPAITGAISGRFFGPQAMEIAAAFSASVAGTASGPEYTVAGAVYGVR